MKIFTAAAMREFDRIAGEEFGLPSIALMENAALRVVEFLEMKFAPLAGKRIVVLCGKGNNGGDGFAIARHLLAGGYSAQVVLTANLADLRGDAAINYKALQQGIAAAQRDDVLQQVTGNFPWDRYASADILLDALLGTGFQGEVRGEALTAALKFARDFGGSRVAVDVPSGLNADSGEAAAEAFRADYTVTFAAPKLGLFVRDGVDLCGEVWVGDIGTSARQMEESATGCEAITRDYARRLLPHRPLDAHKGDAGRVVICGGSYGMTGAPTLASRAALRAGAGLCITCLPDKVLPTFASAFAEATSHPLPCDNEGRLAATAADRIAEYAKGANVVAVGPGLSRSKGALDFARRIVTETELPVVIDADALYALRAIADKVKARKAPTVLTPHPGEMGELMEMKTADVQNDRIGVTVACARKFNAIVVLKGARTVVALPDGDTFINLTGNPGMATGGSGDALTGTIAGLLPQTKDARTATLLGVYAHGLAGDLEFAGKGNGLIAGDIAEALPRALLEIGRATEQGANARLRPMQ